MVRHLLNKKSVNFIEDIKNSPPIIFKKKLKKTSVRKLEYISSDTGRIRHYPPAAQE
jgi:hypothetical protein